jgi:hypothetical protein
VFTAPSTGYYKVSATLLIATAFSAGETFYIQVKQGSTILAESFYTAQSAQGNSNVQISALVSLTSGQTISVAFAHGHTASVSLNTTAGVNFISISQVP